MRDTRKAYFVWAWLGDLFTIHARDGTNKRVAKGRVAICSETQRIALMGTTLHALIVQDTYITRKTPESPEWCEEAGHCIDVDCPLNRLTWDGLRAYTGVRMRKAPKGFGGRSVYNTTRDGGLQSFADMIGPERAQGGILIADRER